MLMIDAINYIRKQQSPGDDFSHSKYTLEIRKEIVAEIESGRTIREVCEEYGCSRSLGSKFMSESAEGLYEQPHKLTLIDNKGE
jgi:transposase-like protein